MLFDEHTVSSTIQLPTLCQYRKIIQNANTFTLLKWFHHANGSTPITWISKYILLSLQWRQNENDGVSNHQPRDCSLVRLFRRRSKKTPKLRVTGLCEGKSLVTGEFPPQMASKVENVSISWRHHVLLNNTSRKSIIPILPPVTSRVNIPTMQFGWRCHLDPCNLLMN